MSRAAPGWARPPAPWAAEDCSTPPFWPPGAAELGAGKARGDAGHADTLTAGHSPPSQDRKSEQGVLRRYQHQGVGRSGLETRSQSAGRSEGAGQEEQSSQSPERLWAGLVWAANRRDFSDRWAGRGGWLPAAGPSPAAVLGTGLSFFLSFLLSIRSQERSRVHPGCSGSRSSLTYNYTGVKCSGLDPILVSSFTPVAFP